MREAEFAVTVSGGSRAHGRIGSNSYMTLHRTTCPTLKRAAHVADYLKGWIADGRVLTRGTEDMLNTPTCVGSWIADSEGHAQTWGEDAEANRIYARAHAERAAKGGRAYRVCGRCKPEQTLTTTERSTP